MWIYHYYAVGELTDKEIYINGIINTSMPIVNIDEYNRAVKEIKNNFMKFHGVVPENLRIQSMSILYSPLWVGRELL